MVERAAVPPGGAYDCVVIGSGNGGLAAAAQLAAKGVKVLLLEQHNVPGGFASSFVRGRFEFETAMHMIADMGPPTDRGGVRTFLEDDLGVHLDWVEIPEAFRMIVTDPGEELDVTMRYGVKDYIDTIEESVKKMVESKVKEVEDSHPGLKVVPIIMTGSPSRKIVEAARAREVDLIVVGNRGTGGILNWMLGSVSRQVTDACTVPVLVVKDPKFCKP